MLLTDFHNKASNLYKDYKTKIYPLVLFIQAESGEFPIQILNEIRSFDFHIACCYSVIDDEELVNKHIDKAAGHIDRSLIDCYKHLINIIYFDKIKEFEKKIKKYTYNVEKIIDNGNFYKQYNQLKNEAKEKIREAQTTEMEATNKQDTIRLFEDAYKLHYQLDNLVNENDCAINELINSLDKKVRIDKIIKYSGWLATLLSLIYAFTR